MPTWVHVLIMASVYGIIAGAVVVLGEFRKIGKEIRERETANENEVDRLLAKDK
jgi:hypothetical protein